MPSRTFYHLPEEKRERLLAAARAEFTRVPYEEASINRIIRQANIPRGSFYMYFTDKQELFLYLMQAYRDLLTRRMGELLQRREGDLFQAFLDLYDQIQLRWKGGSHQEMASILRLNRQRQPWAFLDCRGPEELLEQLRGQIDLCRLDLQTDTDLADLFHLLVSTLVGTLITAESAGDPVGARARLVRVFGILQRGAAAKPTRCEEV